MNERTYNQLQNDYKDIEYQLSQWAKARPSAAAASEIHRLETAQQHVLRELHRRDMKEAIEEMDKQRPPTTT
jgi:hypothetical protein